MMNLPANNKQADYPTHNSVYVHPHRRGEGNNFAYQHCRYMKNHPADNKQADYSINNSVFVQEGRTALDMCMYRCKVPGIVLYFGRTLLIKTRKGSQRKK